MAKAGGCCFLLAVLFAAAILAAVTVVHGMAWSPLAIQLGVLQHTQTQNWLTHDLDIVNIDWLVPIWGVIYVLQFSWLFYALTMGCKHFKTDALIINPPLLPTSMFYLFALGVAGSVGWLMLWDSRSYCVYSVICMLGATIFLTLSADVSLRATKLYQEEVIRRGYICDIWAVRVVVQNALPAYVAWTFVVTAYTITMILKRFNLLGDTEAQFVGLSTMMAHVVVWMLLDVLYARALTHFVVLPYLVYMVAFLQPVLQLHWADSPLFTMALVYLVATAMFVVVKLGAAVWRCQQSAKAILAAEEFGAIEYKDYDEDLGHVTWVHTHFPNPHPRVAYDELCSQSVSSAGGVSVNSAGDSVSSAGDLSVVSTPDCDNNSQIAFITLDKPSRGSSST